MNKRRKSQETERTCTGCVSEGQEVFSQRVAGTVGCDMTGLTLHFLYLSYSAGEYVARKKSDVTNRKPSRAHIPDLMDTTTAYLTPKSVTVFPGKQATQTGGDLGRNEEDFPEAWLIFSSLKKSRRPCGSTQNVLSAAMAVIQLRSATLGIQIFFSACFSL